MTRDIFQLDEKFDAGMKIALPSGIPVENRTMTISPLSIVTRNFGSSLFMLFRAATGARIRCVLGTRSESLAFCALGLATEFARLFESVFRH